MRTFSLKDDCTLSGRRLRRDERRVEGGGYVDPAGGALLPAHGVVMVPVAGVKKGPKEFPCGANAGEEEQAAVREWTWRVERGE